MSGHLDTNLLVRYLTGDPPALAARAADIIDCVEGLRVTDLVLAETAYVLMSVYNITRPIVVAHLMEFVRKRNIVTHDRDKAAVLQALSLCRPSARVSIVDALLWATARSAEPHRVYTLDDRFPRDGIEVRSAR